MEEIGGGVCQTSSTLYNAVLKSGLKTTKRQSHTYEPSYVTPGTDATVSWNGPDYKFVNNSSAAIGIRARYSDQTITVSIYGVPVLEEGVTYSLKSTKINDLDPPAPTYEEDPTLEPGVEKQKSAGSKGSYWETRLIVKKGDEVVSQDVDHVVRYKGHAPVILRNSTGTVAPTESAPDESTVDSSQVPTIAPEGAGDGFIQPDTNSGVNNPGTGTGNPGNGTGSSGGPGGQQSSTGGGNTVGEGPGGGNSSSTQPAPAPSQPTNAPVQPGGAGEEPGPQTNVPPIVAPMPGN